MSRMPHILLALLAATSELVADDEAARKQRLPELVLRADRSDITIGDTVLLTSVIPAHYPIAEIRSYRLKNVWIAATYDPEEERIVGEKQPFRSADTFGNTFSDLDTSSARRSGGLRFTVRDPRSEGFELHVKPRYLGSFLMTVEWMTMERDGTPSLELESQPVLITVRPPKDRRGRPVVKPEWLPTVANIEGRAFADSEDYVGAHVVDGSESLSPEVAAKWAHTRSAIFLEVKTLTPQVARALATRPSNEFPMYLSGLTALEGPDAVAVAKALASTSAPVVIKHLERVSAAALTALRKNASITIPPDDKLTIVP